MPFRKAVVALIVLLLATTRLALAQGTYTQIDVPGGSNTNAYGIDTAGDIVGFYSDAGGHEHGFRLSGGMYTSIDYPGSQQTYLFGINDEGLVVGYSDFRGNSELGFVYDTGKKTFTKIQIPGATYVFPFVISAVGTVAGYVQEQNTALGFVLVSGHSRLIVPPGASASTVTGISALGELVGNYNVGSSAFNFSSSGGKYRNLIIPNVADALVTKINPEGSAIVGDYVPSLGINAGFLYENRTLQTLEFPGSESTGASDINASGEVVGTFLSGGLGHGFTWTPPADAGKK